MSNPRSRSIRQRKDLRNRCKLENVQEWRSTRSSLVTEWESGPLMINTCSLARSRSLRVKHLRFLNLDSRKSADIEPVLHKTRMVFGDENMLELFLSVFLRFDRRSPHISNFLYRLRLARACHDLHTRVHAWSIGVSAVRTYRRSISTRSTQSMTYSQISIGSRGSGFIVGKLKGNLCCEI